MPFATARSVCLDGAVGHLIDVQADVSPGAVGTTLVGRADPALNEARDRCRMAIINSDLRWPATKRITVLLSPADLLKRGTHFDLAICVAVLAADTVVPRHALDSTAFIGEVSLDGRLRCVAGVLPMVLAAAARGVTRVFVPEPSAQEASMVPGMTVLGMRSLAQVAAELAGEEVPEAPPVAPMSGSRLLSWRGEERLEEVDFADLHGLRETKYAVEVAAAGGHHVMLSGPKGSGKTSIAERIPTIIPELAPEESLELTAIHSLCGALDAAQGMVRRAPFRAPHHDASKASLIGGGSGQVRPGEISRAHGGVLFLDEFPLFRSDVIDALRQPMESGDVTIARHGEAAVLPARGMVVLACNPCPCGDYRPAAGSNKCKCREVVRRDYQARVKGPVSDRIDITRHVEPPLPHERGDRFDLLETSAEIRARVEVARRLQAVRYTDCSWRLNGQAPGPALRERWPLPPAAQRLLDDEVFAGRLTSRGAVRVHRLAMTIADLTAVRAGVSVRPGRAEVETALRLRSGDPLLSRQVAAATVADTVEEQAG